MVSISDLMKKRVLFSNSGLVLTHDNRNSLLNISLRDSNTGKGHEIGLPIEAKQLEIVNFLTNTYADAKRGFVQQSAWENPEVKLDASINSAQKIALGYYVMLSFLCNSETGTRDIWLVFRTIHHSLISYLRNRAISNEILMRYKVALLSCHLSGYTIADISKIERMFEVCGLNRQNYIFYLLLVLDGMTDNLVFDKQEKFVLSVANMEREKKEFISQPSIKKLCLYHAHKKLRFITESNRFSPEDMANELQMATQVAYTTVRPLKSIAYSENYARRSMTNTVNRIIHAYTTYESRKRLVAGVDGSVNTHFMLTDSITKSEIDVSFQDNLANSLAFSEDRMIDYLDAYQA